ncbi:transmembrane protein 269 isoform X3 [Bufo gargarizans]|uniref:transmembrane protein 269 isoform X3 n=1 Tax=Bufo gargarizans TaxID=30331 RepID=UPI001CF3C70D|nr:transmembrane protein 269 isoform X3 [Bufo gargarizans]
MPYHHLRRAETHGDTSTVSGESEEQKNNGDAKEKFLSLTSILRYPPLLDWVSLDLHTKSSRRPSLQIQSTVNLLFSSHTQVVSPTTDDCRLYKTTHNCAWLPSHLPMELSTAGLYWSHYWRRDFRRILWLAVPTMLCIIIIIILLFPAVIHHTLLVAINLHFMVQLPCESALIGHMTSGDDESGDFLLAYPHVVFYYTCG